MAHIIEKISGLSKFALIFVGIISFLPVLVLISSASHAAELRIVDQRGLTRAIKDIQNTANVVVVLESEIDGAVKLRSVERIASDIQPNLKSKKKIIFPNVSSGHWRLEFENKQIPKEVRIE